VRAEEAFTETTKERKAREKAEASAAKAEGEVERLKIGGATGAEEGPGEESVEVVRLAAEMDRLEVDHSEALLLTTARHQQEISAFALRLEAAEADRARVEAELDSAREKVERSRSQELQESEDVVGEIRHLHEREKTLLMEENQKLSAELERSLEISTRLQVLTYLTYLFTYLLTYLLQADRRHLEDEYADLQGKKETVAQWETQIAEIIQWVSDEKDARGYLQVCSLSFLISILLPPPGPCRQADRGDGGGEDQRRAASGRHAAREELEEPAVAEAGQDGAAGAAEQPAVGDPGQAGHQPGAQQDQGRARGEQEVSRSGPPSPPVPFPSPSLPSPSPSLH
jgi:hypothetical protein